MADQNRSIPILKTKLHRPAVAGDIVDRPVLLDRLDEGRNLPLTLVSAPAGYGKSSLISGWLKQKGYPYAWLTLETSESELRSFLTYLSASIQTLFSDALSDLDGLLNQDPLPDNAILLTSLSNVLVELESDFILVLDDFHQLNSMEVSTFIDNLLEHPPRRMHVVLITRRDPALKMRSLRLHRRMNEFRSRELRLAREEAKEFLERVSQQELADDTVDRIFSATEGWPVGLRLSALAIRYTDEGPVLEGFSGDTLATQEYLVGEILSKLRPEMREYVESLAILDRFCAGVCEAMFEHDRETMTGSGADLMVEMESLGLPVITLDSNHEWYRFHHLFQVLLRRRLAKRITTGDVSDLHARAADWFESQGFLEEAVSHACEAGKYEEAVTMIVRSRQAILDQEQWYRLSRLLSMIPAEVSERDPQMLLLNAWAINNNGVAEDMFGVIESAEQCALNAGQKNQPDQPWAAEIDLFNGWREYIAGNIEQAIILTRRGLSELSDNHEMQKGWAYFLISLCQQTRGESLAARETVLHGLRELGSGTPVTRGRLLVAQCLLEYLSGDLRSLVACSGSAIDFCRRFQLVDQFENIISYRGAALYQLNRLEEADQVLSEITAGSTHVSGYAYRRCLLTYCQVLQALGRTDESSHLLDVQINSVLESGETEHFHALKSLKSLMAARLGDIAAASKWSEGQDPKPSLDVEFVYSPGLGLAEVLIRDGESSSLERAEQLLNIHLKFYGQTNRLPLLVETHVLYSLLAHARGDLPSALNHLARGFEMSRAGRFLRVYIDRDPILVPLLNQLDLDHDGLRYAGEILAAYQNQSMETVDVDQDSTKLPIPTMDVLSEREQQILTLISEHKSNKQIAEELFIAPGTVKRHTENIYQKLGVHKRQDAVTKAKGLGIL